MTESTPTRPPAPRALALGLSGAHLVALAEHPGAAAVLDGLGLAFTALGVDRLGVDRLSVDRLGVGQVDHGDLGATFDSSVAAAAFATDASTTPFLVVAAPHRDHPYNLARRVASLDHLSGGRAGVLLGERDRFAPGGDPGREAWGGARLSHGAPLEPATTRDAAVVLQELWQSWPADTIVGDRESRIYAEADRIVHIDHHGVFEVAGPLNVPSTPQGSPVLARHAASPAEVEAARGVAEVLVVEEDLLPAALEAGVPVFVIVHAHSTGDSLAGRVAALDPRAHLLLVPDAATTLVEIAHLVAHLGTDRHGAAASPGRAGTLRDRLGLPTPDPLLVGARPAFPAPVAQAAL
ncbi:LLM class flavin-dependent oxidoreductase [Herbiconiux sp. CPCC 203407]|uniref:LLM class flavin-dependent oxidoreductase n=1 Tax=Herbiconiux oxytropis TaxID=2970915 RepID=A0AA41XHE9_9MICO|nr:LLM class flavin-dependent oxidoreductase [Herbiconiux oxytropis]MCS5722181.1 LLM class flavin-dependent oxidoreductase [Herbiconiux oxytropis]MCS5725763.1 LLM class flavin-dependent oxidoreductase [Herbiconiux oxytropis]